MDRDGGVLAGRDSVAAMGHVAFGQGINRPVILPLTNFIFFLINHRVSHSFKF